MNLPFFVARRYLFSRKRKTIINVISWISLIGIAVGSMALIVVLSVYNGIGDLTQSLFNVFDPEIIIEAREGKSFHTADGFPMDKIKNTEGVMGVSEIVEENAWVIYKQNEQILMLRGVDGNYLRQSGLINNLSEGPVNYELKNDGGNYGILLGGNLYWALGVNYIDQNTPLVVHIPKRKAGIGLTIDDAFNTQYAFVLDFFSVQSEIDSKYGVADIGFVRSLLNYSDDEVTMLALTLDKKHSVEKIKESLRTTLGDKYWVKDRFEQQPLYYKIYSSERLGIYLILSLIIIIASFNLIASLSLLIIDKRKDNYLLQCIGATKGMLRRIFFVEGVLISVVGVVIGLVLGFVVCFLQQQFGIVAMGDGNFIVDAFPVAMRFGDFLTVFVLVIVLSMLSVWFTVRRAKF
ncbi:MAG: ABC transporter permease [Bacteroidales bacterium]|nr:ABC transporter permease [Bacteroidales bacterium]MBR5028963.1 ABC transporter permease [Bacteroidales bacterium]